MLKPMELRKVIKFLSDYAIQFNYQLTGQQANRQTGQPANKLTGQPIALFSIHMLI